MSEHMFMLNKVSHKKMISMNVPDTPSEDSLLLPFPNSEFL